MSKWPKLKSEVSVFRDANGKYRMQSAIKRIYSDGHINYANPSSLVFDTQAAANKSAAAHRKNNSKLISSMK